MPPQTRRTSFPKVVIERDTDSEESSSDEDEIDEGDDVVGEEEVTEPKADEEEGEEEQEKSVTKKKTPITISLKKVCKVSKLLHARTFLFLFIS